MKWVIRIGATLIGLLLVGAVVLLAMGQRSRAGYMHSSIEIQAAPDRIWPWLEDPARLKQWLSWLVEVRGNDPAGVGAQRVWVMRDPNNGDAAMEIHNVYTEYTRPTRMAIRSGTPGEFDGTASYHLTDLGNGRTRLDAEGQFHYQIWFAQLMEPLITPQAEKKERMDLAHLKELVEKSAQ